MQTKIIKDENGLNSIEVALASGGEYKFKDNYVRKAIQEIGLGLGCFYYFFETRLNPKANKAVKENYIDFKRSSAHNWHFNADMMKELLKVIHDESISEGIAHVDFPLVENVGVHNVDVNSEQGYWPVVHILKDLTSDQQVDFEKTVEWVLENNWGEIQTRESPFNYNMGAFQLLKDRQIKPLLVEAGPVFTGEQLKKAADWLLRYQYIHDPKTEWYVWDD